MEAGVVSEMLGFFSQQIRFVDPDFFSRHESFKSYKTNNLTCYLEIEPEVSLSVSGFTALAGLLPPL
jgi:hypothetical protein